MAYDELLALRMRDAICDLGIVTEKRMMGGACFMVNGNMLGGADRQKDGAGRFMFRVGKDNQAEALSRQGAIPLANAGRPMRGMVFVDETACDDKRLKDWVALAWSFVGALPPK